MSTKANQMVPVPFYGDVIEAVQDESGVWVSIRRGCESLGLDVEGQRKKLRGKPWAVTDEKSATGPDGKTYAVACIHLDSLPGWLFSIDARKIAEHLREKLIRYQKEAAKVLADHFFGRNRDRDVHARIDDLEAKFEARFEQMATVITGLAGVVGSLVESVKVLAESHQQPVIARQGQRFSIADRCRFMGWLGTSKKQRARIRQKVNTSLSKMGDVPDVSEGNSESNPGTHLYSGYQLIVLDNAISEIRLADEQKEREAGPNLFSRMSYAMN